MKITKAQEITFAGHYLAVFDVEEAAKRCGIKRSPHYYGMALKKNPVVQAEIARQMEARMVRLNIDADFVLSELLRQLARLKAMLGQDMSELYDEYGCFKPVSEWPEVWRRQLVSANDVESTFARSHDGEVNDEDGRTAWDRSGQVAKIKRESTLSIEREIRETLRAIGEHTKVGAFNKDAPAEKPAVTVHIKNLAMVCSSEELQRIEERMLALASTT